MEEDEPMDLVDRAEDLNPTRKINFTAEIEDSAFVEARLIEVIKGVLGDSLIDYQVLTNTRRLYDEDKHFRKLCAAYNSLKKERNDYINNHYSKL